MKEKDLILDILFWNFTTSKTKRISCVEKFTWWITRWICGSPAKKEKTTYGNTGNRWLVLSQLAWLRTQLGSEELAGNKPRRARWEINNNELVFTIFRLELVKLQRAHSSLWTFFVLKADFDSVVLEIWSGTWNLTFQRNSQPSTGPQT